MKDWFDWLIGIVALLVMASFSMNGSLMVERQLSKDNPKHKIDSVVRFLLVVRLIVIVAGGLYILAKCSGAFQS